MVRFTRRLAQWRPTEYTSDGTPVGTLGPSRSRWQMRCPKCGEWTWEDNFCVNCHHPLLMGDPKFWPEGVSR